MRDVKDKVRTPMDFSSPTRWCTETCPTTVVFGWSIVTGPKKKNGMQCLLKTVLRQNYWHPTEDLLGQRWQLPGDALVHSLVHWSQQARRGSHIARALVWYFVVVLDCRHSHKDCETQRKLQFVAGFGELEEYFLPREIGEITQQAKVPFGDLAVQRQVME